MQPLRSELQGAPAARSPSPAEIVKLHDDEQAPVSPLVDLIQGIVYWTILAIGAVVPPIGALYTALMH